MEPSGSTQLRHPTPHVYWLPPEARTDRPVLGAVAGRQATLIVDAGNSPAHASLFLGELAKLAIAPPRFLALTHWHWDHVFGMATFDLPVIAASETRRKVAELAELDWSDEALDKRVLAGTEIEFCRDMLKLELPDRRGLVLRAPDISFDTRIELDLGGVTCQLVQVGGDHDPGSTIVYVPEDKLMFIGDCLGKDVYHGPPHYTTAKLFPLLDRLLAYDAEIYLEGHTPEPIPRKQMIADAELLKTIGREVDRLGPDRLAILSALQARFGEPLQPDHLEIVEAFLAGRRLERPAVETR